MAPSFTCKRMKNLIEILIHQDVSDLQFLKDVCSCIQSNIFDDDHKKNILSHFYCFPKIVCFFFKKKEKNEAEEQSISNF